MENIKYVIYCRKSTDESSDKQTQSIPDQIKRCMEYAEREGLEILTKPEDFSDFETEADLQKQDNDSNEYNKKIYQETRHLFIIKEQQSGKIPYLRGKWRKLLELIQKGKVKGLLSYSPDRQSRNMLEGGEIINLVDEGKIDLKYTNFHFEPNAAGKMMLWMWFVFSKQYSDKLSEDVCRGNKSAIMQGKAKWIQKYGYRINEITKQHEPDGKNFELMKEAFAKKIYERASDPEIIDWLNARGFLRPDKSPLKKTSSVINIIRKDPFYYGIFISWKNQVDLRKLDNHSYTPLITEEEYNILLKRYEDKKQFNVIKKKKDEYADISPIPEKFLISDDGYSLSRCIPNPSRHKKRLEKAQAKNPNLSFADIIQPHHIYYEVKNRHSALKEKIRFQFTELDKAICKKLDSIQLNNEAYDAYITYITEEHDILQQQKKSEKESLTIQKNKLQGEQEDFIKKNLGKERSEKEEEIYQKELKNYDYKLNNLINSIHEINTSERNEILELSILGEVIKNIGRSYRNATYVQKGKILEILFSNIIVDKKKRLTFAVKPWLECLFSNNSSDVLGR